MKRFADALRKRRELGLKFLQMTIGTVAQKSKRKGIDITIEVARLLRDESVCLFSGFQRVRGEKLLAHSYGSPHEMLTFACHI